VILGRDNVFSDIATFFSTIAVVTFGGAYAALAYVAQQAVEGFGWLGPGEMLDGLGMAETTPGPLIMVLQFVGFMAAFRDPGSLPPLLAGTLGGLLATWVTFTPCFLWIFLGAPFVELLRGNRALTAALSAITAAVVGVILNLAIWFSIHHPVQNRQDRARTFLRLRGAGARKRQRMGRDPRGSSHSRNVPLWAGHHPDASSLLGGRRRAPWRRGDLGVRRTGEASQQPGAFARYRHQAAAGPLRSARQG
jgi:chromate transport protein ChrA